VNRHRRSKWVDTTYLERLDNSGDACQSQCCNAKLHLLSFTTLVPLMLKKLRLQKLVIREREGGGRSFSCPRHLLNYVTKIFSFLFNLETSSVNETLDGPTYPEKTASASSLIRIDDENKTTFT
jgi:hypothetical protein